MITGLAVACLVTGIVDGDTLKVRCGAEPQATIRIWGIDAPEKRQAFGERSRQALAELCAERTARVTPDTTDRYGRTVARVECAGVDVSLHMVDNGLAWTFTRYTKDADLLRAQQKARADRLGLWAADAPTAPWEWRRPSPDR